ncbi:MAG: hypothetical protein ABI573_06620 [Chloroflexota bacterium]
MRRGAGLVALAAAALVLAAGCGVARVQQAPEDDLSTWSAIPLPPDAGLTAQVVSGQSACKDPNGGPIRVLLQDRRTALTAAFLVSGKDLFGSCFVTAQGGSSGGSGPLPDPMTAALSIDDSGFGNVAAGTARELGGRVAAGVTRVVVELKDGRMVTASVVGGYWLAWWPNDVAASAVTAFDAAGAEIVIVEPPK